MTLQQILQRRLRRAATFILLGLAIQGATFVSHHPAAFLFFAIVGGSLMFVGMGIFVMAVLHPRPWVGVYKLFRQAPPEVTSE